MLELLESEQTLGEEMVPSDWGKLSLRCLGVTGVKIASHPLPSEGCTLPYGWVHSRTCWTPKYLPRAAVPELCRARLLV